MPISSSLERGSSSRNEGTVTASVTATDTSSGSMRRKNRMPAVRRAEREEVQRADERTDTAHDQRKGDVKQNEDCQRNTQATSGEHECLHLRFLR